MRRYGLLVGLLLLVAASSVAQTPMAGVTLCAPAKPEYVIRSRRRQPGPFLRAGPGGVHVDQALGDRGPQVNDRNRDADHRDQRRHLEGPRDVRGHHGRTGTGPTTASSSRRLVGNQVQNHKWQLTGGSGKLSGVKGQGTCTAAAVGTDGSFNYDCRGNYTLPK